MAAAKDTTQPDPIVTEAAPEKTTGGPTHIRFVGHPSEDENSATVVFGKQFYRGKWVPLTNLDGTNPEKKALQPAQLAKLLTNPAFQVGNGEDAPVPGMMGEDDEFVPHEEA